MWGNELHGVRVLYLAAVCAAAAASPVAQAAAAWFGVEPVERRVQRSEGIRLQATQPEFAPLSLQLPPTEDPYTAISGAEILAYLEDILELTVATRPEGRALLGANSRITVRGCDCRVHGRQVSSVRAKECAP